jgi:hypothetical protein
MKSSFAISSLALCAVLLCGAPAQAGVIIDTGAPSGAGLSNTVDAFNWLAERFTIGGSVRVSGIDVFLDSTDPTDVGKSFTLGVYANNAANLPAFNFNAPDNGSLFHAGVTFGGSGWSGVSGLDWALAAGSYWFAIEDSDGGPQSLVAPVGTPRQAGAVASYTDGVGYSAITPTADNTFGLRVSVPEPTSLALVLGGLLAAASAVRRRQAA